MKERLDVLLVNRGLAPSREKAKTMIMEGNVFVNNNREDKAGSMFPDDCNIEIHGNTLKYVSRGGIRESAHPLSVQNIFLYSICNGLYIICTCHMINTCCKCILVHHMHHRCTIIDHSCTVSRKSQKAVQNFSVRYIDCTRTVGSSTR